MPVEADSKLQSMLGAMKAYVPATSIPEGVAEYMHMATGAAPGIETSSAMPSPVQEEEHSRHR